MEKLDIFEMGWMYEVVLFFLTVVFVIDFIGFARIMKGTVEDKKEHAYLCVKYLKILLQLIAGGFFLLVAFTYGYDAVTTGIHVVLGLCSVADAVFSLVFKIVYRKRPSDDNTGDKA